ncbi:hypothetical protein ACGGY0_004515 [Salmonella enterica]|uniref:hypothetical protein n=1 Tax=Escherichia coli TaxID=562 RepID=UPI001124F303|nr:hypothetical protein [Escherichia coli]EJU2848198.1 hypothetical protein [Salmonella enterica]EJU2870090.1 hypothetical protein [Salmonella enterica]EJU2879043.1 hypothetical protein [Salmonella enterica]EJU3159064.1 hypothetical protein [Salmonella enterica]EJU3163471.1 hypothetical protein [Salmonella enterica]
MFFYRFITLIFGAVYIATTLTLGESALSSSLYAIGIAKTPSSASGILTLLLMLWVLVVSVMMPKSWKVFAGIYLCLGLSGFLMPKSMHYGAGVYPLINSLTLLSYLAFTLAIKLRDKYISKINQKTAW